MPSSPSDDARAQAVVDVQDACDMARSCGIDDQKAGDAPGHFGDGLFGEDIGADGFGVARHDVARDMIEQAGHVAAEVAVGDDARKLAVIVEDACDAKALLADRQENVAHGGAGADEGDSGGGMAEQVLPDPLLEWQERALCAQTDPESFFPEKGGSTREAKKVCLSCEVRVECLEYALANDERFGIWGGLSERERRRLKKFAS